MSDKSQAPENGEVRKIFGESAHGGAVFEGQGERVAVEEVVEKEGSFMDGERLGGRSGRVGCQTDEGVKGASSLGAIMGGAREENEGKVAKVGTYQKLSKIVHTKGGNMIVVRYEEKMDARGRMREGRKERQKGREEERRRVDKERSKRIGDNKRDRGSKPTG